MRNGKKNNETYTKIKLPKYEKDLAKWANQTQEIDGQQMTNLALEQLIQQKNSELAAFKDNAVSAILTKIYQQYAHDEPLLKEINEHKDEIDRYDWRSLDMPPKDGDTLDAVIDYRDSEAIFLTREEEPPTIRLITTQRLKGLIKQGEDTLPEVGETIRLRWSGATLVDVERPTLTASQKEPTIASPVQPTQSPAQTALSQPHDGQPPVSVPAPEGTKESKKDKWRRKKDKLKAKVKNVLNRKNNQDGDPGPSGANLSVNLLLTDPVNLSTTSSQQTTDIISAVGAHLKKLAELSGLEYGTFITRSIDQQLGAQKSFTAIPSPKCSENIADKKEAYLIVSNAKGIPKKEGGYQIVIPITGKHLQDFKNLPPLEDNQTIVVNANGITAGPPPLSRSSTRSTLGTDGNQQGKTKGSKR